VEASVELMTHPINRNEQDCLNGKSPGWEAPDLKLVSYAAL